MFASLTVLRSLVECASKIGNKRKKSIVLDLSIEGSVIIMDREINRILRRCLQSSARHES